MGCDSVGPDGAASVVGEPVSASLVSARLECAGSAALLSGAAAGRGAEACAKHCAKLAQDSSCQLGVPGASHDCHV